jgi:hypothetical protein
MPPSRLPSRAPSRVNSSSNLKSLAHPGSTAKQGKTWAYQGDLPKLPIPTLEDSCTRYLKALEGLQVRTARLGWGDAEVLMILLPLVLSLSSTLFYYFFFSPLSLYFSSALSLPHYLSTSSSLSSQQPHLHSRTPPLNPARFKSCTISSTTRGPGGSVNWKNTDAAWIVISRSFGVSLARWVHPGWGKLMDRCEENR